MQIKEGACVILLPRQVCLDWFIFELNDASIMSEADMSADWRNGAFIASAQCNGYAWELLKESGRLIVEGNAELFIFRTSVPRVAEWAKRFNAQRCEKPGHRPRYLFTLKFSPEWFTLCEKAYRRNINFEKAGLAYQA